MTLFSGLLEYNNQSYVISHSFIKKKIYVSKHCHHYHIHNDDVKFIIEEENEHSIQANITSTPSITNKIFIGIIHHFYKNDMIIFHELFGNKRLIKIENIKTQSLNKNDIIEFKISEYSNENGISGIFINKLGHFSEKEIFSKYIEHLFVIPLENKQFKEDHYNFFKQDQLQRRDLTRLITFSIDPEGSKDIDDCFSLEIKDDHYLLYIHIADVGYFVKKNGSLFQHILQQCFTIYLPHHVFHLLPSSLSTDKISLIQNADRYAVTTQINIRKDNMHIQDISIYPSIIHNHFQISYEQFKNICENEIRNEIFNDLYPIKDSFCMIADHFNKDKLNIKSITFSDHIHYNHLDQYHHYVENLMLLNNHIIAEKLKHQYDTCMYRNHSSGDIDHALSSYILKKYDLKNFNFESLEGLLKGDDDYFLNFVMTLILNKAYYHQENSGHFGLNSSCYTHFTSPIRRLPDLINHHLLFYDNYSVDELDKLQEQINKQEMYIQHIEYFILNYDKFNYYLKNEKKILNKSFHAIVFKIKKCSLFIYIPELSMSLKTHISEYTNELLILDEQNQYYKDKDNHIKIQIGQMVQVEIIKIIASQFQLKYNLIKID